MADLFQPTVFLLLAILMSDHVVSAISFPKNETAIDEDRKNHTAAAGELSAECINKTFLPHECSAVHFYRCVHGHKIKMRCPEGRFFDSERLVCDWPPRGSCKVTLVGDCTPTAVYFPNYDDPTSFYQCANGQFYKFQCPSELVFNRKLNVCDWPQNVDGTKYQPKVARVNCYSNNCDEKTSDLPELNTSSTERAFKASPTESPPTKGFFIREDGWVPVAGPPPSRKRPDVGSSYSSVRWPVSSHESRNSLDRATTYKTIEPSFSESRDNSENSGSGSSRYPLNSFSSPKQSNDTYHLVTATTRDGNSKDRSPVGWVASRAENRTVKPLTDKDWANIIPIGSTNNVQVSIDTAIGVVDVSNNITDFSIHFKPNSRFEDKTISTNFVLSKDMEGITSLKANVQANQEQASFTIKMKRD